MTEIKNFTLKDAKRYLKDTQKSEQSLMDFTSLGQALQVFAQERYGHCFKILADRYVKYSEAHKEDSITLTKEPLAVLEWLCMGMDHGFSAIGYKSLEAKAGIKTERLPIKDTQRFFQGIYGSHFYLEDKVRDN